jgi:hypothetical protein
MNRPDNTGALRKKLKVLDDQMKATDIPRVFFSGDITGLSDTVTRDVSFTFVSKTETFSGVANLKWQGTSSLSYPKKNFTMKMYTDATKATKLYKDVGWGKQTKYCLKANYMDHTHARNIVSARLWSEIVDSRDSLPDGLAAAPKLGPVDGFPIKLYMNGVYQGIYTWNIPKDGWMFAMSSSNPNHAILCAESQVGAGAFRSAAVVNGNDWSLEFPDAMRPNILTSFNDAIALVMNSTDLEFKAGLSDHFDVASLIDYYLFAYFICGLDSLGKNMLMVTYDGVHWIASMYDMDSTWGLYWDGGRFVAATYRCPEDYQCYTSLLWERLVTNFSAELYARYTALRASVLSTINVIRKFEAFTDVIPPSLYSEDVAIYPNIPSSAGSNIQQIRSFLVARSTYVDTAVYDVTHQTDDVTGVTLNKATTNINAGGVETLVATVLPSTAADKTVSWASSDTNIVTVSSAGIVTAVSAGSATITVTTTDGSFTATCAVTVNSATVTNLFNPAQDTQAISPNTAVTVLSTGVKVKKSVAGGGYYPTATYRIPVQQNTNYYLKMNVSVVTGQARVDILDINGGSTNFPVNYSFNSGTKTYIDILLYCHGGSEAIGEVDYTNIMLSTTDSAYVGYNSPTYSNLLSGGDCETITGWSGWQSVLEIDSVNKYAGTNCIKIINAGEGSCYKSVISLLNKSKYYMFSAYVKNGTTTNMHVEWYCENDAGHISSPTSNTTTAYQRLGVLLKPEDFNASGTVNAAVVATGSGSYGFLDNAMLNEITVDDYAAGVDVCLSKYQYKAA